MTGNSRIIAELQALQIGIHLVGLDRLPEVMRPVSQSASPSTCGTQRSEVNPIPPAPAQEGGE